MIHTARNSLEGFSARTESARNLLESCINEAHVLIKASRFINEKDPHSTVAMLLLQPGQVTWAHCGDSLVYRFRGVAPAFRSVDHSYVEHLIAKGRITPQEALTHPNRNVLLTSLGGKEEPKIDFGETADLAGGDSFVLCSDGVWAYFDDAEMGTVVAANSARQACEILIEQARVRAHGTGDNLSLAIVKLNGNRPAGAIG